MKRVIVLILISTGFVLSLTPDTAEARTHYRHQSRFHNNYYYRNSATFGIRSPYFRTRRSLNVPVTRRSYRPTGQIVYMGPAPAAFYNPWRPMIQPSYQPAYQPVFQPSYQPMYTRMAYPYPQSNIRMIGPMQPTIIERERIIVERPPATTQIAPVPLNVQIKFYTPSTSTNSTIDASEQFSIAQQLFRERKYTEAAQAFNTASGLKPGDAKVKMGQSLSLLAVGDYQGSGASLRRALEINSEWYVKPIDPTEYYGENKDLNAHLMKIERFVDKNPKHVEAKLTLGYFCYVTGRMSEAADNLAEILEINPNDLETMSLLGNLVSKTKQ